MGLAAIPAQPAVRPEPAAPASAIAITPTPGPRAPFLRDVIELSVGGTHVCALTAGHEVVCWGDNAAGQLGIGKNGRSAPSNLARPHVVGGLPPIAHVAAGVMHTCAIDREGSVFCWGSSVRTRSPGSKAPSTSDSVQEGT